MYQDLIQEVLFTYRIIIKTSTSHSNKVNMLQCSSVKVAKKVLKASYTYSPCPRCRSEERLSQSRPQIVSYESEVSLGTVKLR
jgi:hypothetical protein